MKRVKERDVLVIGSKNITVYIYKNSRRKLIMDIRYSGLKHDHNAIHGCEPVYEQYVYEVIEKGWFRSLVSRGDKSVLFDYFIPVRDVNKKKIKGTIEVSIISDKDGTRLSLGNFVYGFDTCGTIFDQDRYDETNLTHDDINIINNVLMKTFKNVSFEVGIVELSCNHDYIDNMMD